MSNANNTEENQYLGLVNRILTEGEDRSAGGDSTQALAVFKNDMHFDLSQDDRIPLLTTKYVSFKDVLNELLWFISGGTDATVLKNMGTNIWIPNTTRENLDKLGFFDREVGDAGPIYGWQWRHWGAEYVNMHTDYTGQGCDQLMQLIKNLKKEHPFSRRHILSAWNVTDIPKMVLPPCHIMCQFYVDCNGMLHCLMYQRSADVGLGLPYNITSYAILTRILAHVCDLRPGSVSIVTGDTHIYKNHIGLDSGPNLIDQVAREPREFPRLRIVANHKDIDKFTPSDFQLEGYDPHPRIKLLFTTT